jgi:hypothetical protein
MPPHIPAPSTPLTHPCDSPSLGNLSLPLQEPPKADLLAFEAGVAPMPPRRLHCVLQVPLQRLVLEVGVQLHPSNPAMDHIIYWTQVTLPPPSCIQCIYLQLCAHVRTPIKQRHCSRHKQQKLPPHHHQQ